MTALAVNEVVSSNSSEFLNTNESTETNTCSMKLAMTVDDDAMTDTIETPELTNGFSDLIDEKNSKESFVSDTAQSDTTSHNGTPGTPRSEHSTPMEDVEDNYSIKLVLSDDEEDVELESAEKGTEKCDTHTSVKIETDENLEMETTEKETEKSDPGKTENFEEKSENVETANQTTTPEIVEKMETDSIIPISLNETGSHELTDDNTTTLNDTSKENQESASVNDILSELDSCLSEDNPLNLDNSNANDVEMDQKASEESLAIPAQSNVNNEKEEDHSEIQINDVPSQEKNDKINNDSTEGNFQISNVSSEVNFQINNDSTETDIQISSVSSEADFQISEVSTEGGIQITNISSELNIQIGDVSTEGDIQISNVSTEGDIQISNVSTEEGIQISNVSTEEGIQISNVSTEEGIQISNVSTEAEMQISNTVSVGDDIRISNVSTEEDYDKEFKLSMEENFDNDKSEEENEKQSTKTDEETTDNDDAMNDEIEKSEEDSNQISINLDEDESDSKQDSSNSNEIENIAETQENQSENLETAKDAECVETSSKRTSETFKRKLDESLDECIETKKMKTDPNKSQIKESSKCDQESICQTELNETDPSVKHDDKKSDEKDENESKKIEENKSTEKDENKTLEKDENKIIEDVNKTNEKEVSKTIEKEVSKTIEKEVSKTIEKDKKTIKKDKIKTVEKEIKTKTSEKKKAPESKKKLILRMLPLLFENEPIPNANVEEIILTKIIEVVTLRTELATLRQKAQSQEQLIDQLRRKATHLSKQLEDINTVTHRLTIDLQSKDRPVAPVKITRSVGLQVSIPTGAAKRFSTANTPPNINKKRPITNSTHHNNSSATNNNSSSATNHNSGSSNNNSSATNTSQSNVNSSSPVKSIAPTTPAKSPSLLNKALTKPASAQRNAAAVHSTPSKQSDSPAKQNKASSDNRAVTVDLTDDDSETTKNNSTVAQNPPGLIPLTGNLRMVTSLGNTLSTTSTTNQTRGVTYLMATPGPNRVLIATTPAANNGPRPALTVLGQPRGVQGTRYLVNTTNGQQAIVQRPGVVLANGQTTNTVRTVPVRINNNVTRSNSLSNARPANPTLHPAPLPIMLNQPHLPNWRQIPPRPSLKISRTRDGGIQLSWSMPELDQQIHEEVASYQLYAYQEGTAPPSTDLWRKVGDVKALPLPMACTLTSFHPGNKYYFAVRAIDVHSRVSPFSYAQPISLLN